MEDKIDQIVIPGETIGTVTSKSNVRLVQGLFRSGDNIIATKPGVLRFKSPDRYWVESVQKRVCSNPFCYIYCLIFGFYSTFLL